MERVSAPIRIVGVFAHPDDDVFSVGGTFALHASGVAPTLVFCTSGENGPIWVDGIATRDSLGAVREREQVAAMEGLGVRARSVFLRYPDGGLTDVSREELIGTISAVLREVRPHVVVTFGADGLTSHPDHVRAGEATSVAFERLRAEAGEAAPQRLLKEVLAPYRPHVMRSLLLACLVRPPWSPWYRFPTHCSAAFPGTGLLSSCACP